jgi:Fuc2NAc and GlcNAc transferase
MHRSFSIAAVVLATSYLLTRAMLAYCQRVQMMDVPNERSSHTSPTPRGGGVAIVLTSLAAFAAGVVTGQVFLSLGLAMLVAGVLVATVGLWDDYRSLHPGVRLTGQFVAAGMVVEIIGTPQSMNLFLFQINSTWLALLSVIAVVWLINLTNFMDGIDGLAAAECVFVMSARGVLLYMSKDDALVYPCFWLAAAALGFLLLNWPPARIFMGDVGSGYIGLAYGALLSADIVREPTHLWVWLILLGTFLTDSTVTLLRRAAAGRRVWEAHRSHAYQHVSRGWGHARTTRAYLMVNLLWLAPLAACASRWPQTGPVCFLVATVPLAMAAWYVGAGMEEKNRAPSRQSVALT